MNQLLAELIAILEETPFCDHIRILETSFFSFSQFAIKIRCIIFAKYTFQIRLYYNRGHFDYSYQVFSQEPLCRWDNKEHFQILRTFPHHYHNIEDEVIESPLQGEPIEDLKLVLVELKKLFG
ncbi:hypothetical protein JW964_04975 [candidate division KSB1 bacterium]|nr:hypothetical protein [candidate division KSB1 bacterium]